MVVLWVFCVDNLAVLLGTVLNICTKKRHCSHVVATWSRAAILLLNNNIRISPTRRRDHYEVFILMQNY